MLTLEQKTKKIQYNKVYFAKWYAKKENKIRQNNRSNNWVKNHLEHYRNKYTKKLLPIKERFLLQIKIIENGCWEWQGLRNKNNYGQVGHTSAHRFSYEFYKSKIPKGICVCHTCDNPPCVNPNHLWLGTRKDNNDDRDKKGRGRKGKKYT